MLAQTNCEIEVVVHGETARAWLVSIDEDPAAAVWAAKSQCTLEEEGPTRQPTRTLKIPEWLAIELELL